MDGARGRTTREDGDIQKPPPWPMTANRRAGRLQLVHGVIKDLAYLGSLTTYHVVLDGGNVVKVTKPMMPATTTRNWPGVTRSMCGGAAATLWC